MAEADPEDGHPPEQAPNRGDRLDQRLRIAGSVGEEHAVGLECRAPRPRSHGRHHVDLEAPARQRVEDVPLDPEVERHDTAPRRSPSEPIV